MPPPPEPLKPIEIDIPSLYNPKDNTNYVHPFESGIRHTPGGF
jgi:hypothetical protein